MSRWECGSGHTLEGLFYVDTAQTRGVRKPDSLECPYCRCQMVLSGGEGANLLLDRVREYIGEVSRNPNYSQIGVQVMTDLEKLETTIRKLAAEAARP